MREKTLDRKHILNIVGIMMIWLAFVFCGRVVQADPLNVKIDVTCQAEGLADTFWFSMEPENDSPMPVTLEITLKDGETGQFILHPDEPGTWTYTIQQTHLTDAQINFDKGIYTLVLSVVTKNDGTLYPETILTRDGSDEKAAGCRFVNTSTAPVESTPESHTESPAESTPESRAESPAESTPESHTESPAESTPSSRAESPAESTPDKTKDSDDKNKDKNKDKNTDSSSSKPDKKDNTSKQTTTQSSQGGSGGGSNGGSSGGGSGQSVSGTSEKQSNSTMTDVQTGDTSPVGMYTALLLLAAVALTVSLKSVKRR